MFNGKEKKLKKSEEEAAAKAEAEFQAKYAAKQEKRKVEKIISDVDKTIQTLMTRAADAKAKGYTDMYRSCISFIKVARARKKQAEVFLFQMEAMQEMQSLSKSSAELLGSMSNIMNSLGKLSLDKTAMLNSQKDFSAAQMELDKQTANIEQFLSGMEMRVSDDESADQFSDSSIEAEIDSLIMGNSISIATPTFDSSTNADSDLDSLKKLLES